MKWELHRIKNGLGRYKEDWDRLNRDLCRGNPYFDVDFIEPLLCHFSSGTERLCVLTSHADVKGMLIAERISRGIWSTFLPAQAQVAPVMVSDPCVLRSLISKLSPIAIGFDFLNQDPEYSPLKSENIECRSFVQRHAFTVSISLQSTFEDYWAARSKKLRQNIERRFRRAADSGYSVHLARVHNPDGVAHAVRRFGELESKGWKGKAGTAVKSGNVQGRFYIDLMKRFAQKERATAYELYFDDRLVASRLAISSDDMLVMLKTTYDEAQAKLSPGRLLLYLVLQEEFARRRSSSIEFYTNANADLAAWSTTQRWINHHLILRNAVLEGLYSLRQRLRNVESNQRPVEGTSLPEAE